MEPYFNDVCEAYFIQNNGNNNYPLITELPSLNLDMEDELEAVTYLFRFNEEGADYMLDENVFARKQT